MNDLDLEERPATSPGALRLVGRLGTVVGAAIVAVALLVALVLFGPFAGIRSIFVTHDPQWGTCATFALSDPCHEIPLSTIETSTGLTMPVGSRVVDSTASDVDFKGYRHLSALVAYPAGKASPLTGPTVLPGPSIVASNRLYSDAVEALTAHGVRRYMLYSSVPKLTSWTCVTGSNDGVTYLAISVYDIDVHSSGLDR